MDHKKEFIEFLYRSIGEISQDTKILFEMLDDGELDDKERLRSAGTLLYLLAPGDLIPDTFGLLGHADDSLVMRMTMNHILVKTPDRKEHYEQRYPEVFGCLEQDLGAAHAYLGEIYPWIETWLERLERIEFKGKKAEFFLDEDDVDAGSWLYDEINEALLDIDFDDDDLKRELRKVDRILPLMEEKMRASRR